MCTQENHDISVTTHHIMCSVSSTFTLYAAWLGMHVTPGSDVRRKCAGCQAQSQYAPLSAADVCDDEGGMVETLAAWSARAAEDRQLTVRDVWGLMLHSVRGAGSPPC